MGKKDKKVKKSKKVKSKTKSSQQYVANTSTTSQVATSIQPSDTDDDATKKTSLEILDGRNEWEKTLFEYVESGRERQEVRDLITANHSRIDINKRNKSNQDILTKAVEKKDEKMIKLLLRVDPENIKIENALLSAIKDGDMHMVLLLLAFLDSKGDGWTGKMTKNKMGHLAKTEEFDNSTFGRHITPLGMAAKYGHYEIIQVLWDRGAKLPELHMPSCDCPTCKKETRELEKIKTRLNLLKAKCSPTFLIFQAGLRGDFDPVYESFQLIGILDKCIDEEPEFKEQYEKIKEELEKFPTALLNLCRTNEETKQFLGQREGYVGSDIPYPRLAYAIQCNQKTLVAHPNAQYLLYMEWRENAWIPQHPFANVLVTGLTMLFFPIINIFLWFGLFCCGSMPVMQHFLAPINRCASKWASQIFFCIMLYMMNKEERTEAEIVPPTIFIRWLVVLYAVSHAVSLVRLFLLNPKGFFKRGWNYFDVFTVCSFGVTFAFWIICFIEESEMGFEQTKMRRHLKSTHPLLLGECALAVSTLCAGLRLLRVLILNSSLGPLQCAFTKMSRNLFTFAAFYFVAIATYALGTQILFRPYQNLTKVENNVTKYAPTSFNNVQESMETFFWSFFGGLKKENVEIFTPKDGNTPIEQTTTQFTATLIQMSFQIIVVLFLGGMLTGLFSNTQETILGDDKDTNWKFLRSQEWLYHIQDSLLAPPFNMLPNGFCLLNICSWISSVSCSKNRGNDAGCDMDQCCFMRDVESQNQQSEIKNAYPFLLRSLFQRYFQYVLWQESEESKPEKKDVETIQDSVIELRKMTEELLQKMGRNSGDASTPPGASRVVVASTPKSGIEVIMNPKSPNRRDS